MRAGYVNEPQLLTPVGNWIAARLPHMEIRRNPWSVPSRVFRLYGFSPYYGLALVDYTEASFYSGKPRWRRLRLLGMTVFERNRQLSGLPGVRSQ